jgi:long-subunit fatty acid transport protein
MQNFHTIFKVKNSFSMLSSMLENLGMDTFYEKKYLSTVQQDHFKIDLF